MNFKFKNNEKNFSPLNFKLSRKRYSEDGKPYMKNFLTQLLSIAGNEKCADCSSKNAKWTSLNLGVRIKIRSIWKN